MPEGAEVKIIGENLAKFVGHRTLTKIETLSGRYTKSPIDGLAEANLPSKVLGVGVKGKLIFWMFENDAFLFNTLGMTGSWSQKETKHARIKLEFDVGLPAYFSDSRNFGTLKFIRGRNNFLEKLDSLGPDMLSEDVSIGLFQERLMKYPEKTLPEVLMNQSVICGVGNYVKAEALWRARLSPHRKVETLSSSDFVNLNDSIKEVLRLAYRGRGASIRDYKDPNGDEGDAALDFAVYGLKKDPLGNNVIKEDTMDGRVTHWSPNWQK
jgi:formamidopyrimidine-DNA glycosylase